MRERDEEEISLEWCKGQQGNEYTQRMTLSWICMLSLRPMISLRRCFKFGQIRLSLSALKYFLIYLSSTAFCAEVVAKWLE